MSAKWDLVRLDPEEKFGLRALPFTGVGNVASLALGVVLTVLFYGILVLLRLRWGGAVWIEMFFHGGAAMRSTIPYITVLLAMWCLAILLLKRRKLSVQRAALAALPAAGGAAERLAHLAMNFDTPEDFIGAALLKRRLRWQSEGCSRRDAAELFENSCADFEKYFESTFTEIRGFIWAIPVLGFIGTVLGLARAVGGFGALTGDDGAGFEAALRQVTGGLATAFETTLIALAAALILQIAATFQAKAEEDLLAAAKAAALDDGPETAAAESAH